MYAIHEASLQSHELYCDDPNRLLLWLGRHQLQLDESEIRNYLVANPILCLSNTEGRDFNDSITIYLETLEAQRDFAQTWTVTIEKKCEEFLFLLPRAQRKKPIVRISETRNTDREPRGNSRRTIQPRLSFACLSWETRFKGIPLGTLGSMRKSNDPKVDASSICISIRRIYERKGRKRVQQREKWRKRIRRNIKLFDPNSSLNEISIRDDEFSRTSNGDV